MLWYTLGLALATGVLPTRVVRSGGFPFTPPGTYSRHTAKYPAATSASWEELRNLMLEEEERSALARSRGARSSPGSAMGDSEEVD